MHIHSLRAEGGGDRQPGQTNLVSKTKVAETVTWLSRERLLPSEYNPWAHMVGGIINYHKLPSDLHMYINGMCAHTYTEAHKRNEHNFLKK